MELTEFAAPRPRLGDACLGVAAAARQPHQGQAFRCAMAQADDQARQRPDRRAALLRQAYGKVGWLPAASADAIEKIAFDRATGTVRLLLKDGSRILDDGRQVVLSGALTSQAANELVAVARRRGWTEVELTGSKKFCDQMAVRLALAQPPIAVVNHRLSPELQRQVDDELGRRAASRLPQEAALDFLRGQVAARRSEAAELDQARGLALDRGAQHDRAAENALFAITRAKRELADHRRAQPSGLLAALTGRAAAWRQEEERRLEELRLLERELADLRERKGAARAAAEGEARDLDQQVREQRCQADAFGLVATAARGGDARAIAAAHQDPQACLRLAKKLRREAEAEELRRREAELARRLVADRQQGPSPGPTPSPRPSPRCR